MGGILWVVFIVIVAFWLIGFIADIAGGLIHLLLVVAVLILLYNLFVGRKNV
jgi:hypothetical protein